MMPVDPKALPASNGSQRRHLVMTLATVGVLEPRGVASFRKAWVDFEARRDPPEWKSDWRYTGGFWRGSDGIEVKNTYTVLGRAIQRSSRAATTCSFTGLEM
jgi:hypothetical protein